MEIQKYKYSKDEWYDESKPHKFLVYVYNPSVEDYGDEFYQTYPDCIGCFDTEKEAREWVERKHEYREKICSEAITDDYLKRDFPYKELYNEYYNYLVSDIVLKNEDDKNRYLTDEEEQWLIDNEDDAELFKTFMKNKGYSDSVINATIIANNNIRGGKNLYAQGYFWKPVPYLTVKS